MPTARQRYASTKRGAICSRASHRRRPRRWRASTPITSAQASGTSP